MTTLARHNAWVAGCRPESGNGHLSPGDMMFCGGRDYNQPYPCPNGLPIDRTRHEDCPAWQRRIERARRDIQQKGGATDG